MTGLRNHKLYLNVLSNGIPKKKGYMLINRSSLTKKVTFSFERKTYIKYLLQLKYENRLYIIPYTLYAYMRSFVSTFTLYTLISIIMKKLYEIILSTTDYTLIHTMYLCSTECIFRTMLILLITN